ncbi:MULTISPECIES: XTP/dITP diphosphatase [Rossellomorea]|uniref:XTP/dITP diphosphatase n=1 Tax=Rossellomorea TaxID=2837508 RepID=UPI001E5D24B2|nr:MULTISPECIES: XTP/dITP diphosphatase [Rossellomorea]MCC5801355.1 XTP/dITP diphosphatase [Rossellomorea vietnamensis]UTE76532.1 XTP/dITP diphosphatase [Rossellomorea sp. KS-H15a]WGG44429.1 XTP/dITP diphosphatase [Rossellomorea sp. DA94]
MTKRVIIATKNRGKAKEFQHMFAPYGYEVQTLLDLPHIEDVEETGVTFEENAILKAETVAGELGALVIADDSGLAIDALEGRPGVYSARYAGEEKSDEANMAKVLDELESVEESDRTARFHCVLAIAGPDMETKTVTGSCEGMILREKRGTNGFGYDPIFFVPSLGKTMAELTQDEKSQISHRGHALEKLGNMISDLV